MKSLIYTTGQAAEICRVCPRTVAKWFDSRQLKGYRIPGSGDRRIPKENLVRFMREHSMPLPCELDDRTRVLVVGVDPELLAALTRAMEADGRYAVAAAAAAFDAGIMAATHTPQAAVIDLALGRLEFGVIAQSLRALPSPPVLVALTRGGDPPPHDADAEFRAAAPPSLLPVLIRDAIELRAADRPNVGGRPRKVRAAAGAGG